MPAQTLKRRKGLKDRSPRAPAVPEPGLGGYDYPRGPYGATGFPGSTPAARDTHPDRRPEGARGLRQLNVSQNQAEWVELPTRRANGTPRQPRARQMRSTSPERREIPRIGGAPGSGNVRNQIAQRYKARPELWRPYRPSANPGKTGAHLDGAAQYHPGTQVSGHPDGKPIPGMPSNPGMTPPLVTVQSRFSEPEGGSQEGYAVNRPLVFAKGGVGSFQGAPNGYNFHLRGGRLTGQRYFGALADQQRIGLDTDAYGLSRARGPRHRPVRFEQPTPWAANYYDLPPSAGQESHDMIHRSPGSRETGRHARKPRRG